MYGHDQRVCGQQCQRLNLFQGVRRLHAVEFVFFDGQINIRRGHQNVMSVGRLIGHERGACRGDSAGPVHHRRGLATEFFKNSRQRLRVNLIHAAGRIGHGDGDRFGGEILCVYSGKAKCRARYDGTHHRMQVVYFHVARHGAVPQGFPIVSR